MLTLHLIGILTIIAGAIGVWRGHTVIVALMIAASIFGAAAALYVSANDIGPAQLLLCFALMSLVLRPGQISQIVTVMQPPKPGFWLACFIVYSVATAFFLPRILAGVTDIVPLGTMADQNVSASVPLGPVSSNFTQSFYLVGSGLCFLLVAGAASTRAGFKTVTYAVIMYCFLNILTAIADMVTSLAGNPDLLKFMRNARYDFLNEARLFGMKRIAGAFTEASAFARATMGALGFTATLWLCGRHKWITGPLALLSLIAVAISTSSTGLAVLPFMLAVLMFTAVTHAGRRAASAGTPVLVALGLIALIVITVSAILLNPTVSATISAYADLLVFNKMETESGIERSSWNVIGLQNFVDTWGLGVGLGTTRSSSFAVALISNVGVVGIILYFVFMYSTYLRPDQNTYPYPRDVKLSARNAAIGLLLTDVLASSSVDQGFLFYALAGLMVANPDESPVRTRAPAQSRMEQVDA